MIRITIPLPSRLRDPIVRLIRRREDTAVRNSLSPCPSATPRGGWARSCAPTRFRTPPLSIARWCAVDIISLRVLPLCAFSKRHRALSRHRTINSHEVGPTVMKSMLRTTSEYARLYAALSFLGILSLAWSACCVVLNPLLPKRHGKALGRWVNTHSFRMYLGFLQNLGVARFDLSELDLLRVGPPLIIAPNHPSLLDAVMIISRVPGVSCIMKSAAVDNAFLGAGARLARYIRNDSVHGMVRRAIEDIQQGHS